MSRYASQGGGNAVAANVLSTIAGKESSYKESIHANHGICLKVAMRIAEFEQKLPDVVGDENRMSKDELVTFLRGYRDQIKQIAAANVEREREVQCFVAAVRYVHQTVASSTPTPTPTADGINDDEELPDYQARIAHAMKEHRIQSKAMQVEVTEEKYYREVAGVLSEASGPVDEDIQLVGGESHNNASLKCPITGTYMDDAVKNSLCGHVYSEAGIRSHIRSMLNTGGGRRQLNCACPYSGCVATVAQSQLEQDMATILLVRQAKRREDRAAEFAASQATELDDTDEEEM